MTWVIDYTIHLTDKTNQMLTASLHARNIVEAIGLAIVNIKKPTELSPSVSSVEITSASQADLGCFEEVTE